ncbi:transcriptional repressor NF-X1-like, partial [Paramuricea clavata]
MNLDDQGKSCGWRCPACQFVEHSVPNAYRCFCGKVEEPKWYPQDGITPHSCGELCFKKRIAKNCAHPCNQLCHPGPCPSCPVTITKKCCCGKTTISVRCGNSSDLTCSLICGKKLNCAVHLCQEKCHAGSCEPCAVIQEQSCYCGQSKTEAVCGVGSPTYIGDKAGYFSCGAVCSKKLDCGNHECEEICHASNCRGCELQPDVVVFCSCGKMKIVELLNGEKRNSCLDSIPCCGNTCDGFLPCAKYNDITKGSSEHRCKKLCHHGDCSVCDGDSIIKCRCRATSKKMKCIELNLSGEPYMCERKCNKKFDCGRHRCSQKCCPGTEHKCTLTCGKKLKCGKHKCMEPCHSGSCPPCLIAGFDEVFCPCGATVQEPPIPCGKPSPVCHRPCSRMHPCEHE